MPERAYDCIVIGSGPGGYVAAIRAAQLGMKTAVVEKDKIGGRCLNYACIPAKAVLRVADILSEIDEASDFGITVPERTVDFAAVGRAPRQGRQDAHGRRRRPDEEEQDRRLEGEGGVTSGANLRLGRRGDRGADRHPRHGLAAQADPGHGVRRPRHRHGGGVGARGAARDAGRGRRGRLGRRDRLGLRAHGHATCCSSRRSTACSRRRTPTSPRWPAAALAKQNIAIHTETLVEDVKPGDDKVSFRYGDKEGEADWLVIAAGRGPDIGALGLEEAGVELDDHGLVAVDGRQRTSLAGVYAIGDLVRGPALAHKASDEGIIAVEDAAGREVHPLEYQDIPRATFCSPNVASFGLTEAQAREEGLDIVVGKLQYGAVGAGTVYGDRGGVVKVIGETPLRRAGRRAHRRRQGDRPHPGAREREGPRGRLLGGGAHRARPPHVLRSRHGGRPGRRWLAHPRIAPVLLRPRVARGLSRGGARGRGARDRARVRPRPAGRPGRRRRGRLPLRRGGGDLPRRPGAPGRRGRPPAAALAARAARRHGVGDARGHLRQAGRPRRGLLPGGVPAGVRGRARPRRARHRAARRRGRRDAPGRGAQGRGAARHARPARRGDEAAAAAGVLDVPGRRGRRPRVPRRARSSRRPRRRPAAP